MLFKTAGRRVEIDVHMPSLFRLNLVGTFIRFPLLGEVFREYGYWIHTPWKEVKAIEALWQARRAEWEREADRHY